MIRGTVRANRAMGKINTNDGTRGRCHSRKDCVDRNEGVALAVGALTLRSLSESGVFDGKKHADGQQSRYDRVPFLRERVIYRRKDSRPRLQRRRLPIRSAQARAAANLIRSRLLATLLGK